MNPNNQKIELVKGGRKVDGQFEPYRGLTRDNRITNAKVRRGDLPASRMEIYPQAPTPQFSMQMPESVPSTLLKEPLTFNDVLSRRNAAEQGQLLTQQLGGEYDQLLSRMQSPGTATPFQNPEQFLNNLLLNRPTETQTQLDNARMNQAGAMRQFAGAYQQAGAAARDQFDVTGLTQELQGTRTRYAERAERFRQDLRNIEVNSEQNAVSREFVDDAKNKIQADATAELADLSIIEAAQVGNLELANGQVESILAEMEKAIEFEKEAIQTEIDRLAAIDTREAEKRASSLSIALQNYSTQAAEKLATEREKRGYMVDAASNGADQGTLDAIRQATTPGEAALLAGPWVGRLQRLQAEATLANTYDQIRVRNQALREAAAAAATEEEQAKKQAEADADAALEIKSLANELASAAGLDAAVGFGFRKSVIGSIPFVKGDAVAGSSRADFEATAGRLANLLTLDNLDLMSGVLSETDIKILETSGSNLKNYSQSEEQYKKEIQRIIDVMDRTISNNGITAEQATFWGLLQPDETQLVDNLWESL